MEQCSEQQEQKQERHLHHHHHTFDDARDHHHHHSPPLCCRIHQWQPLLRLFLHSPSPVGAAIHWVQSHGYAESAFRRCKTRTTRTTKKTNKSLPKMGGGSSSSSSSSIPAKLWKLVPELLAFKVAVVVTEDQQAKKEEEEEERWEENVEKAKQNGAVIVCLWIQTLPTIVQSSILTFLSAQSELFRPKDLEFLSRSLLASSDLNFWVAQEATNLLHTVSAACHESADTPWAMNGIGYHIVPDWLKMHGQHYSPLFPHIHDLLPIANNCKQKLIAEVEPNSSRLDPETDCNKDAATHVTLEEDGTEQEKSTLNVGESQSSSFRTQLKPDDPLRDELLQPKATSVHVSFKTPDTQKAQREDVTCTEEIAKEVLGAELYMRAKALRERLLEMQPGTEIVEEINVIRRCPEATVLLNVIKLWEVDDEITLLLTENLLRKEEGFLWSTKIMSYVLLPKLLSLEVPASRILMTAVFHACKTHRRAAIDALLIPLLLCLKGPNTAQCEVVNRVLKECLPPDHMLSFCEKLFLKERRQKLQFSLPPPNDEGYIMRNLVWSEPVCVLIQNLLNQKISLDEETLDELVGVLEKAVGDFVTSLKFSNLLLSLITKHGPRLLPYRGTLQRVLEKTKTFMTKSALAKLEAL